MSTTAIGSAASTPPTDAAPTEVDVVVIGAGQAGLSSAYFVRRFGLGFVVLDAEPGPGGAWRHRSPTLTMEKIHDIFDLPGVHRTPEIDPALLAADVVPRYFADYERRTGLPILRPVKVRSVTRHEGGRLLVTAERASADAAPRTWAARAVINATGTWTRPHWPYYPGAADFRGRQLHYADYRGPEEFAGAKVVIVGGGASATHVLSEVADVAETTIWVTRSPLVFHDGAYGEDRRRAAVARVEERVRAGLPPQSVVSATGLAYTKVIRDAMDKGVFNRLPMFSRITPDGVMWDDGRTAEADVIIWATGFRSAIGHLAPLKLRGPGGGIQMDGTRVVAEPRLHLVGYGPSASTVGANRAGRTAAQEIRRLLAAPHAA
ncbi:NAD(P)-binding domain-containing protein [Planotetraspora phitsanulokensis]|uniref:NAD(P)-binding domain-containing protein n=1 Tax=Planotetraspora phitsanulokensis TaxID=575192 RepID=UPI001EF2DF4D|nr:NAD(P)-binding domain-containing protein [Planotetraspora phitsanulokensis]